MKKSAGAGILKLATMVIIGGFTFLPTLTTRAQTSGIWTGAGGDGLWTGDTANWSGNVVASGADQTADFSQVDISGRATLYVDAPVTIGSLIFGDADTNTPGGWFLAPKSTNVLTLTGASPTITVNALGTTNAVKITGVLACTNGWIKDGPGSLVLAAVNTFSNGVTIKAGTLYLDLNGANSVTNGNTFVLGNSNGAAASLLLGPDTQFVFNNAVTLGTQAAGPLIIGNAGGSHPNFGGPINLNSNNLTVQTLSGTGVLNVNGGITGVGNLVFDNSGPTSLIECIGAGSTVNNSGTVTVQGTSANTANGTQIQNIGSNVTAFAYNTSITPLTLGPGTWTVNTNGVVITSASSKNMTLPVVTGNGSVTLNANSSGNITITNLNTYTGTLINTGAGAGTVIVNATVTNAVGIIQGGASPMILARTNTYTGLTIITNGVLALTNSASISNTTAIAISNGGTFNVAGLTNGPFNLVNSQTLQASGGTVNGNLTLQSSAALGVNYGGTPALTITGGALNLNENPVTITVSGSALAVGSYQLVSVGAGGSVSGAVDSSVVTINGAGAAGTGTLQIAGDGLYLVVASGGGSGPGQPQGISVTAGQVTIAFSGIAGDSYGVQRSTNLVNWTTIWTTNAPAGGVFGFTDPFGDLGGTPPRAAYYRLTW